MPVEPVAAPRPKPVSSAMAMPAAPAPATNRAPAAETRHGSGRLTDLSVEPAADGRTVIRLVSTQSMDVEPMVLQNAPRLVT